MRNEKQGRNPVKQADAMRFKPYLSRVCSSCIRSGCRYRPLQRIQGRRISQTILFFSEGFLMDTSGHNDISSTKAVLLGALASGVNGPTWSAIKITFLTLGVCFAAILALSFSSNDFIMIIHVILLVVISGTLFLLLSNFLAQTGLVSIEQQMEEMGLGPQDPIKVTKDN